MALSLSNKEDSQISSQQPILERRNDSIKNAALWGEFDNVHHHNVPLASKRVSVNLTQVERDLLARLPRPLPLEGPRIHQPGSVTSWQGNGNVQKLQSTSTSRIVPLEEIQPRDPYVLGGILLLNYAAELRFVLDQIKERHALVGASAKNSNLPKIELPPAPAQLSNPLPSITYTSRGPFQSFSSAADRGYRISGSQTNTKDSSSSQSHSFQQTLDTNVKTEERAKTSDCMNIDSNKFSTENLKINQPTLQNVLRKSVATITAFQGYDTAVDSAIDMLTDAAAHYMKRFCLTLRSNRDKQLLNAGKTSNVQNDTLIVADQGFADIMDRTLHEIGNFESLKDVPEYYSHSVVGRYQGIVSQCRQLLKDCHHQASIDIAYPNMASASIGNSNHLQTTPLQLATGVGQTGKILEVSAESILETQNLVPEIHFASSNDMISNDGTLYVSGSGTSSILGAVLSGPQATHPIHPLVHPSGAISVASTPTAMSSVAPNNVPTFSLDHNTPQIESGLQMLQSLEQGGHFSVSATATPDGNNEDPVESPAPILTGIVGASPVLELHPHNASTTQGSLLIKTANTVGVSSKFSGNVTTDSAQNRKRRRTPEGQFSL